MCLRVVAAPDSGESLDATLDENDALEQSDWPARLKLPRCLLDFVLATKRGRHEDALVAARRGERAARSCGAMAWAGHFVHQSAVALVGLRRYEEALCDCKGGLMDPDIVSAGVATILHGTMANSLVRLRRLAEAREALINRSV